MNEKNDELILLEHVFNKLCHDLAGTIGGITNSIEFLDNKDLNLKEHAQSLLKRASGQLVDQFQFFRKLYGHIDVNLCNILQNFLELAKSYLQYQKVELDYKASNLQKFEDKINGLKGKIIINVLYFISKCLMTGGKIEFLIKEDNVFLFILRGTNLKFDTQIEEIINNKFINGTVNTVNAQITYTLKLLQLSKLKFILKSKNDEEVILELTEF